MRGRVEAAVVLACGLAAGTGPVAFAAHHHHHHNNPGTQGTQGNAGNGNQGLDPSALDQLFGLGTTEQTFISNPRSGTPGANGPSGGTGPTGIGSGIPSNSFVNLNP